MRKVQIDYICDFCGETETTKSPKVKPVGWRVVQVWLTLMSARSSAADNRYERELCTSCSVKFEEAFCRLLADLEAEERLEAEIDKANEL